MPQTILLSGEAEQYEGEAGADITPGELLTIDSNNRYIPHDETPDLNGNGTTSRTFARESVDAGRGIDDDYLWDSGDSEGDNVKAIHPTPGSKVYAWLEHGENVSEGDPLESAGNGALQAHSGLDHAGDNTDTVAGGLIAGFAAEDLDAGGESDPVRIEVKVA